MKTDLEILRAALIGYQGEQERIAKAIADIRAQLRGAKAPVAPGSGESSGNPRRQMSAAARRRIAAGQKKRWAAYHSEHPAAPKKAAGRRKRRLSPEGRERIIAALKKRWAAARKQSAA